MGLYSNYKNYYQLKRKLLIRKKLLNKEITDIPFP